jgi:hypothetical protein
MDAEWILWRATADRSMWPAECCAWVAGQLGVKPYEDGSATTWLALVLERRTDRDGTVKRLLAALGNAPEGSFTNEDLTRQQREEMVAYDRWVTDRAEGHGRREGNTQ